MRTRRLASILSLATALPLAFSARTAHAGDVLLLGAELASNPTWIQDVRTKILNTGRHAVVDTFDVRASTPSSATLSAYDAVLVWSDAGYADPTTLANLLADYVDAGHGVVEAQFSVGNGGLPGRWQTDGYRAIAAGGFGTGAATLVPVIPDHPLLSNVFSFDGGSSSYRGTGTATSGSTLVASWSDNSGLLAWRPMGVGRVVSLNMFPPSSTIRADFWNASTDGSWLMSNALAFASDVDADTIGDLVDNCPNLANPGQADADDDGLGDACDPSDDGDDVDDTVDNCLGIANDGQADIDDDGIGDACEDDRDDDGIDDDEDNCVGIANPGQEDDDDNGIADACQSGAEPLDVLVLQDSATALEYAGDIQAKLQATGRFSSVAVAGGVPLLADIVGYDAIIVFTGISFSYDGAGMGNVLADFADQGGGVVVGAIGFDPTDVRGIGGRFDTGGYLPFARTNFSGPGTLSIVPELTDHPLLDGVSTFNGGGSSFSHFSTTAPTAVEVAAWDNGLPLIAAKRTGAGRVAGLNFFLPSSTISSAYWDASTDGATIMANALEWAGGCDGVDFDDDGVPDACDSFVDRDGDTIIDADDNCIDVANTNQEDLDDDGVGDACDDIVDSDEDGIADEDDNCPFDDNEDQADTDEDGDGNACDDDDDDDGVDDVDDNCDLVPNANQADDNGDGIGDACEDDQDGDGIPDDDDNCPITANASQADADGDGIGDACDSSGEGGGSGEGGSGGSGEGGTSGDGGAGPGPGPGPNTSAGPSGSGGDDGVTSASGTDAAAGTGGGDAASDGDDSGCGCEVPGGATAPRGGWLAAAVAGLAMTVRRRRRSA